MSVLSISRDWGVDPAIVRMSVTDSLATITTTGYLTGSAIAAQIEALNSGAFQWLSSDVVLIQYDVNWNFFYMDATTNAFVGLPGPGGISNTLPSGDILVGNGSNVATAVTASGDFTNDNAGVFTITNGAVNSAKVNPDLLQYAAVAITATEWNAMYATPFQLVAAPGANKLILVSQCALLMTFGTTQYAAGGVVGLQYDSTAHGAGDPASATEAAADFNAAATSTSFRLGGGLSTGAAFTTSVNKALYISNQTAAFTTGDSPFVAHVYYSIIPTV